MTIDRLGSLDRMMLWVSRRWPQDVGAIAILDGDRLLDDGGRFRIEVVRDVVGRRVSLARRFRQVVEIPGRWQGGPLWVDAARFDIADHVRELRLEAPTGEGDVLLAIEQIRRQPMDPSRPMWEMWFLTGLPDRRIGWFVRIHHTIADGMAAMATLTALLDPGADVAAAAAPPWRASPRPSSTALVIDSARRRVSGLVRALAPLLRPRSTLRGIRTSWPAIRELLAEEPATRTSLDRMVGPGRRMALVRADLGAVKAIGRAHGATVNDVLLAATAAGLRAVLVHRGERVAGTTVRAYVPVSLRRRVRGVLEGNLIAQMAVPLEMDLDDPSRRLEAIARETTRRKERARVSLGLMMRGGGIGRRVMIGAVMRQRVNVATACIPGPTVPLHLAGARVLEVFPVVPLSANEPLGVGALSYAGTLSIGITADADAFPDLDVLTTTIRDELRRLAEGAGIEWREGGDALATTRSAVTA